MNAVALSAPLFLSPERRHTIRLYGPLGARFGRVHRFVCTDAAGALRALCAMVPGFEAYVLGSRDRGLGYAVFVGRQNIGLDALAAPAGGDDIRIAPVITGSGRGGAFQIILGAALVGAAFMTGGVALGAKGLVFSGLAGQMAFGVGVSMVLGGVSQLLTKQPGGLTGAQSPDNKASYHFNGPVNVTAQGNPVPVLYGEMVVGSVTVSGDLYAENQQ